MMRHSGRTVRENVFAMAAVRLRRPPDPHDTIARIVCERCGGFLEVSCSKADLEAMNAKLRELVSMREGICGECREGNHSPFTLDPKRGPISET